MSFLPVELARSKEWHGVFEFPSYNRIPLVKFQREIAVTAYPFGVIRVHNRFRSRTYGNLLFKRRLASMCYPRDLRSEAFNVRFLPLKNILRNEQGESTVANSNLPDLVVEPILDAFPHMPGVGFQNVAARYIIIVQHVSLRKHLVIPTRKVIFLRNVDTYECSAIFFFTLRF